MPKRTKLAYSLGFGPIAVADKGLMEIGMPVFNIIFGISPGLVTLVMGLSRVWDAFTDPMVGNISDNLRTRWGRRRPLIAAGSVCGALFLAALYFMPHGMSEAASFSYYLVFTLLFYTALSFHMVPYEALGYVISPDNVERSRVFVWRAFAAKVFMISLGWSYAFLQSDLFTSDLQGTRVTGLLMGGLVLVSGLLPAFFVKERGYENIKTQAKVRFRDALRGVFQSAPAKVLLGTFITLKAPSMLIGGIDFYVFGYYITRGDLAQAGTLMGVTTTVQMIASIAGVSVLGFFVARFEKKTILYWGIFLGIVASALKYVCYTPAMPYLVVVPAVLIGPSLSAVWALLPAMMADVVDKDEYDCGIRREGTFSACWQWTLKFAAALGMGVSGFLLQLTGFDESLGADQAPVTLSTLRIMVVMTPLAFYFTALVCIRRYPLDSKTMDAVKTALEERRGPL